MAERPIASMLTHFGTLIASPSAFLIVLIYAALWFVFERDTFDWHAIATLATWLMTLVIQRSEHRDTQAIHPKLDELLRALEGAQTGLAQIDDEEPEISRNIGKRRRLAAHSAWWRCAFTWSGQV